MKRNKEEITSLIRPSILVLFSGSGLITGNFTQNAIINSIFNRGKTNVDLNGKPS